jgi:phosphoribosylformylglycinamidine synthase subunit PurSL
MRDGSGAIKNRISIRSASADPRAESIVKSAKSLHIDGVESVLVTDLVWFTPPLDQIDQDRIGKFLADPLLQNASWTNDDSRAAHTVEVAFLPGVTDAEAREVQRAASILGVSISEVATGRRYEINGPVTRANVELLTRRLLANAVVERWSIDGEVEPPIGVEIGAPAAVEHIALGDESQLAELNRERGMALDPQELTAIRTHFQNLGRMPTDVELEMIAQTWSEHCAHKTFRARLLDERGVEASSLLGRIRQATDDIAAPFVLSAFVGNAGIVTYDGVNTLALKCETHNHPSAVEPFGGANTGVGGVIRDILGAAHDPIACTDILCFGPQDLSIDDVPTGSLHPQRIHEGVVAGVADYGNKIGLPTIAGAVLYDTGYVANPLVFAGCIGESTVTAPELKGPFVGDAVVLIGGRTGRDGIRGATFSSLAMDASTGEVAGASVQIGDPLTERLVMEVLREARGFYTAITDCGAGGLSSAVGEMADGIGAKCELDLVPLKYSGLAPWEIWLSESQERMVLAATDPTPIRELCAQKGVDFAVIGVFTGDNHVVVTSHGETVLDLDTAFLHDGRPQRVMEFVSPEVSSESRAPQLKNKIDETLLELLAHPNIASKASVIHRYDHEIGGATTVRPLSGSEIDGHSDGTVWINPRREDGFAIGIGVNPWFGIKDSKAMGWLVVDEAIRNAVCAGANPELCSLLDNFSWGDPRDPKVLGQLSITVDGMCDASRAFGAPFVSGKDSLNNAWTEADGTRSSIPPTLVVTAVAAVNVAHIVTSDLKSPGNLLVLLGETRSEFGGSHLEMLLGEDCGAVPRPDPTAPLRYKQLHKAIRLGLVSSAHDCAEGGLAVALAEMCIGGRLGARVDRLVADDVVSAWFSESSSRIVLEVAANKIDELQEIVHGPLTIIGEVTADAALALSGIEKILVEDLVRAWQQ